MIEQTELVVKEWIYISPSTIIENDKLITSTINLDIMKKSAVTKKGFACRFTCKFLHQEETILLYVAEDSYVIDIFDKVDRNEILKMIRNSYSKFNEKFEFRKLGTVLQNNVLNPLDEFNINIDAIVPLIN